MNDMPAPNPAILDPKFRSPEEPVSVHKQDWNETFNPESDKYLILAKELAAENYNQHRNTRTTPELGIESLQILWFVDLRWNFKVVLTSSKVFGLIWIVTYIGANEDAYAFVDVFKRVNGTRVSVRK